MPHMDSEWPQATAHSWAAFQEQRDFGENKNCIGQSGIIYKEQILQRSTDAATVLLLVLLRHQLLPTCR